jgi:hypothetical protein
LIGKVILSCPKIALHKKCKKNEQTTNYFRIKRPSEFTLSERQQIVEEYLLTKCKKRDIWEKYTGEKEEHGQILRWMRQLGYEIEPKYSKLAINKTDIMAKRDSKQTIEELQMKEKIKQLEQALVNSELQLLGKFLFYKEL